MPDFVGICDSKFSGQSFFLALLLHLLDHHTASTPPRAWQGQQINELNQGDTTNQTERLPSDVWAQNGLQSFFFQKVHCCNFFDLRQWSQWLVPFRGSGRGCCYWYATLAFASPIMAAGDLCRRSFGEKKVDDDGMVKMMISFGGKICHLTALTGQATRVEWHRHRSPRSANACCETRDCCKQQGGKQRYARRRRSERSRDGCVAFEPQSTA